MLHLGHAWQVEQGHSRLSGFRARSYALKHIAATASGRGSRWFHIATIAFLVVRAAEGRFASEVRLPHRLTMVRRAASTSHGDEHRRLAIGERPWCGRKVTD
jgi:hypothetical protein